MQLPNQHELGRWAQLLVTVKLPSLGAHLQLVAHQSVTI